MKGRKGNRRGSQAGFSMIELLMAAYVLAIGMLGLAMLQAMAMSAARGGKNLTMAVKLAQGVMDKVEQEGRQSWLNITDSTYASPTSLSTLKYVGQGTVYMGFDASGAALSTAPVSAKPAAYFVATVTETSVSSVSTGSISDYTVLVEYSDTLDSSHAAITRKVNLLRRILHG